MLVTYHHIAPKIPAIRTRSYVQKVDITRLEVGLEWGVGTVRAATSKNASDTPAGVLMASRVRVSVQIWLRRTQNKLEMLKTFRERLFRVPTNEVDGTARE